MIVRKMIKFKINILLYKVPKIVIIDILFNQTDETLMRLLTEPLLHIPVNCWCC